MENTKENKEILYSLYYGQRVAVFDNLEFLDKDAIHWSNMMAIDHLDLKPLSSISIQDSLDAAKLVYPYNPLSRAVMKEIVSYSAKGVTVSFTTKDDRVACRIFIGFDGRINFDNMPNMVDHFLRSKGYALKFGPLHVEDQLAYNWIKLRAGNTWDENHKGNE